MKLKNIFEKSKILPFEEVNKKMIRYLIKLYRIEVSSKWSDFVVI
jgi:hypothetical protein